jgi:hypothetical protein
MGYGYSVADGARTIMLEPYDDLDCFSDYEDEWAARDDYEMAWVDMEVVILASLSKAWLPASGNVWRDGHPAGRVIAESKLHELLLEEGPGGYGYAFLSVVPRHSLVNGDWYGEHRRSLALAKTNLDKVADAIFRKVHEAYPARVPGGYMSSEYRPSA